MLKSKNILQFHNYIFCNIFLPRSYFVGVALTAWLFEIDNAIEDQVE